MDYDQVLEKVGGWNLYQIYMYIVIGIAGMHPGAHNIAQVFTAWLPAHTCQVEDAPPNMSVETLQKLTSPPQKDDPTKYDSCRLYRVNYSTFYDWNSGINASSAYNFSGYPTYHCNRWRYDRSMYETSIVMQWDLVCGDAWKRATAQSIYMFGFLTGCIGFGSLSDRIGRKPTFLVCIILLVVTGTAAAFAPEYWSYVVLRWISGTAAAGSFTSGFVMTMEMIEEKHRTLPGLFYQGWFALGYMGLAGIAYLVRRWQTLQLIIAIPPIIFVSCYWLMDESTRWLISQSRYREAEKIVRKMARMNRRPFPEELFKMANNGKGTQDTIGDKETEKYSVIDLLRPPRMRRRAFNTFFNWFVNSMVFYGLAFGVSDLGGSPHLNLTISGLVEFPGYLVAIALMSRIGRRWCLMVIMVFGGVACVCSLAIPHDLAAAEITLSMLGKLAISGSFSAIYVFSAELFPTVIRNTAVGAGSMHARVGGIVAPLIAELRLLVWAPLPIIIFGASSIAAGLLALLLPETLHQHLPETLKDGELFGTKEYRKLKGDKRKNGGEAHELNHLTA